MNPKTVKTKAHKRAKQNEAAKRSAVKKGGRKTDNTRKAGYDEKGKLDNPKH